MAYLLLQVAGLTGVALVVYLFVRPKIDERTKEQKSQDAFDNTVQNTAHWPANFGEDPFISGCTKAGGKYSYNGGAHVCTFPDGHVTIKDYKGVVSSGQKGEIPPTDQKPPQSVTEVNQLLAFQGLGLQFKDPKADPNRPKPPPKSLANNWEKEAKKNGLKYDPKKPPPKSVIANYDKLLKEKRGGSHLGNS